MKDIINWIKNNKLKTFFIILGLLILFIGIPLIINYLYLSDLVLVYTDWGAKEVLSFYGSVLTFLGTTSLGIVTIILSNQANDMNKRMLDLELSKTKPCLTPISGCYDLYVGNDMNRHTDYLKVIKNDSIVITPLFVTTPRSGITTSIAALDVEFINNGTSNIVSIFIDKIDFSLSVSHDLSPAPNALICGDTSFRVNEKKKILFEFKQEFFEDQRDKIVNIDINDTDILPYINMELILTTQEGYKYREKICIQTNIVLDNNNKKKKYLRLFRMTDLNIEMEDTHNANT